FELKDAVHQPVCVLHLLDRLFVLVLRELREAPVLQHPVVQEVLVDRRQLGLELAVQKLEHLGIALHRCSPADFGADAWYVATPKQGASENRSAQSRSLQRNVRIHATMTSASAGDTGCGPIDEKGPHCPLLPLTTCDTKVASAPGWPA